MKALGGRPAARNQDNRIELDRRAQAPGTRGARGQIGCHRIRQESAHSGRRRQWWAARTPGRSRRWCSLLLGLGWAAAYCSAVSAEVLLVGPQRSLHAPSDAAAVARDGDVVRIDPGEYVDCAIWRADRLVLKPPAGEAHMRDRACAGKAIWVISGADVTVENIAFSGARVPDQNGAGLRAEGRNLTVRQARFDNENGIPRRRSRAAPSGSRAARSSATAMRRQLRPRYLRRRDRPPEDRQASTFASSGRDTRASSASAFEASGSTTRTGPEGTASYLIDITSGGEVAIADNQMQKGPNWTTGALPSTSGAGGAPQGSAYRISHNRFRSDTLHEVAFATRPGYRPCWRATSWRGW